jgi:hypothetical protein
LTELADSPENSSPNDSTSATNERDFMPTRSFPFLAGTSADPRDDPPAAPIGSSSDLLPTVTVPTAPASSPRSSSPRAPPGTDLLHQAPSTGDKEALHPPRTSCPDLLRRRLRDPLCLQLLRHHRLHSNNSDPLLICNTVFANPKSTLMVQYAMVI